MCSLARLLVIAGSVSVLSTAAPATAQVNAWLGRVVVAVEVDYGGAAPIPGLGDLLVTRVGAPLVVSDVRASIRHLFSLGRFRDIRVDATDRNGGVALRYALLPVQVVDRIEFTGALGLSRRRLRDAVEARYGDRSTLEDLAGIDDVLRGVFRDQGFLDPRIDATPIDRGGGLTTLTVQIDAGPPAHLETIEVVGRLLEPEADLRRRLGLRLAGRYDREALERGLADFAEDLRRQGYYEAEVDHVIDVRPGARQIDLTLRIEPGPHVSVVFDGDPLAVDVQRELVPIARESSVDLDLLEDSSRRIEDYLRQRGFVRAVAPYTREEAGGELRIVYHVERGVLVRVRDVTISGHQALPLATLVERLGVAPGDPFVEATVSAGMASIVGAYRAAGYPVASVTREVVEEPDLPEQTAGVDLRLTIRGGIRVLVGSIVLEGAPEAERAGLEAVLATRAGEPYVRATALADRDAILQRLLDRGFEAAAVRVDAIFAPEDGREELIFVVEPGPQVLVDHVLVSGNSLVSVATIRRELTLIPGQPLSRDRLAESQRRLSALGLFRRIRFTELSHGSDTRRDVLVSVEEAPATTLSYGGGFEAGTRLRRGRDEGGGAVERFEIAPRGFFQIGRRNLWGKNRSIDLFTRVSLRPRDDQDIEDDSGEFGFNEYRVLGTYREPRAFGSSAELLVSTFIDQSIRSSFNLRQRGVRVELRRLLAPTTSLSGGYTFNQNRLFDERFNPEDELLIDRLFPGIALSAFSGTVIRDSRDDPFEPTRGALVSVDSELAGRRIGSEVGFAKALMQGFLYRRLGGADDVIFATGIRVGLATGFPRVVVQIDADGEPILDASGAPLQVEVRDLPASERFFAGGDTTVRGFALDRLGDEATIDQDGFPLGGNGLVIINTELRVPLWGSVGAVAFLDVGNVFERVETMRLSRLRGGAGFGVRYRSPIGPIRVDLGFKLDRRDFANGTREGLTALHVSIGQAF